MLPTLGNFTKIKLAEEDAEILVAAILAAGAPARDAKDSVAHFHDVLSELRRSGVYGTSRQRFGKAG